MKVLRINPKYGRPPEEPRLTASLFVCGVNVGPLTLSIEPQNKRVWRATIYPESDRIQLEAQSWRALRRRIIQAVRASMQSLDADLADAERAWAGRGNEPVTPRDIAKALAASKRPPAAPK